LICAVSNIVPVRWRIVRPIAEHESAGQPYIFVRGPLIGPGVVLIPMFIIYEMTYFMRQVVRARRVTNRQSVTARLADVRQPVPCRRGMGARTVICMIRADTIDIDGDKPPVQCYKRIEFPVFFINAAPSGIGRNGSGVGKVVPRHVPRERPPDAIVTPVLVSRV